MGEDSSCSLFSSQLMWFSFLPVRGVIGSGALWEEPTLVLVLKCQVGGEPGNMACTHSLGWMPLSCSAWPFCSSDRNSDWSASYYLTEARNKVGCSENIVYSRPSEMFQSCWVLWWNMFNSSFASLSICWGMLNQPGCSKLFHWDHPPTNSDMETPY